MFTEIFGFRKCFCSSHFFNGSSSKFQHSSVCGERNVFLGGHGLSFFMSPSMGSVGESCSQTGARSAAVTREAMESCPSTFAENAARKSARQCQNLQCCHSSLGRLGGFEASFLLLLDDLFFFVFVKLVL